MTRYLVWALIDTTTAILLTAAAIGAADAHAWPLTVACTAVAAWCLAAAYYDLNRWTNPKETKPCQK